LSGTLNNLSIYFFFLGAALTGDFFIGALAGLPTPIMMASIGFLEATKFLLRNLSGFKGFTL